MRLSLSCLLLLGLVGLALASACDEGSDGDAAYGERAVPQWWRAIP